MENQGLQYDSQNIELDKFYKDKEVNTEPAKIYCKKKPSDEISFGIHCIREMEWKYRANSGSCKSGACIMALNYGVRNKDLKPVSGINN